MLGSGTAHAVPFFFAPSGTISSFAPHLVHQTFRLRTMLVHVSAREKFRASAAAA